MSGKSLPFPHWKPQALSAFIAGWPTAKVALSLDDPPITASMPSERILFETDE